MKFTQDIIDEITEIVDFHFAKIVWGIFGNTFLPKKDKEILKKHGFDIKKLQSQIPPYWQNWMFGLLSGKLKDLDTKKITYKDFLKYLQRMQFEPPTPTEIEMYNLACQRTYGYLKGLGDKTKKDISSYITQQELDSRMKIENTIKEEVKRGVLNRSTTQKIASNIASSLNSWDRDWNRIVATEYQSVFNMGRMQSMMREEGEKTKFYFDVYPGACQDCIRLYLTNGVGSQPRLFSYKELVDNGTNIGRRRREWKATVFGIHPFCRCTINKYIDKDVWNKKTRTFEMPKEYKRKTAPHARVKITVGDKVFYTGGD